MVDGGKSGTQSRKGAKDRGGKRNCVTRSGSGSMCMGFCFCNHLSEFQTPVIGGLFLGLL